MKPDEIATKRAGRDAAIARVLQTEDGKLMMEALEDEFLFAPIDTESQEQAHITIGLAAAVLYLRRCATRNDRRKDG